MKNSMKRLPATLLLALALLATPVFAQEPEHKGVQSEESKPGMEIWKWANFLILAGVLGYLIRKHMGPLLVARSQQIQEGLAAGERAKADAEARSAAVMAKLSGLEHAIGTMRADALTECGNEGVRLKRETTAELTRIGQNAAFEIESAGKLARLAVRQYAAKLAIERAEQKVRARMSPDVQAALLQNFLNELGTSSSAGKLS
jgi:F-type H+-transporting ATPase subunit b